jgi:hypothetical protein
MAKRTTFIDRLIHAAQQHGELSEPEMEIGDLQGIAYALWRHLTTEQRKKVEADEALNNLIVEWVDQ